jgi:hypothetical protein
VVLLATEREIRPAKRKKGKFTKKPPNGFGGRAEHRNGGKGGGQGKGKGKGKGKGGDRKAKPLCHNWSKGNGHCRYAAACNFSHNGPQGGGKKKWKDNPTSLPSKAVKRAKKEIMSRSASDKLLELCRGAKKKSVGMIGLNLLSPDFVPSLPKPTFKCVLMLPRRGMEAREFQPVNRSRTRDASEAKAGDVGEETKKNEENPISRAHAMSGKVYDEENLEK